MWTLHQGREVVRDLQPLAREIGYHVCLGGGVLNEGQSDHDLDLFFLPLHGHESKPKSVMHMLHRNLGRSKALRDSPDYGPDVGWQSKEQHQFTYLGKRIDIFIL